MCTNNACCGPQPQSFTRADPDYVRYLEDRASAKRPQLFAAGGFTRSILSSGNLTALEFQSTPPKSTTLIFAKLGICSALDLKVDDHRYEFPSLDLSINAKLELLDQVTPFDFNVTLKLSCQDVANPSTLKTDLEIHSAQPSSPYMVDWNCLKQCAPACISCGDDLTCWLACAGACIITCL